MGSILVVVLVACGGRAAQPPYRSPAAEPVAPVSTSGLPEEDLPAVCAQLDSCCQELGDAVAPCREWPDTLAMEGVSAYVCTNVAREVLSDPRAGSASSCGPLYASVETAVRAPLAESEVVCGADEDCVALGAGRVEWCNAGGVIVAANRTAASEVQARLDGLELHDIGDMPSVCPLPLPRCVAHACELEWRWASCSSDAECVRLEQGGEGHSLANACRAGSAQRLAREIDPTGERGLPRVSRDGVVCDDGRCRLTESLEP